MLKKMDKKDYEILRTMIQLGTTNSQKLANITKINAKTIRNRIKKYQENKVFKKAIVVDANFFNYSIKADFFLKIAKNVKAQTVIEFLINNYKHNLLYLGYHWSESDDISLQVIFRNTDEILDFKKAINDTNFVINLKMVIVPTVLRDTYQWMPDQSNFIINAQEVAEIEKRRLWEKSENK